MTDAPVPATLAALELGRTNKKGQRLWRCGEDGRLF
jgi:hypothetical protein